MFLLERPPNSVFTYSKYRNVNLPDCKMQFHVSHNASVMANLGDLLGMLGKLFKYGYFSSFFFSFHHLI